MESSITDRVLTAIAPLIRQALENPGISNSGVNPPPEETAQRAAILRAMRAYCGLEQAAVAQGADLSLRTVGYAEKGHGVSIRAWQRLMGFYGLQGLSWDGRAIMVAEQQP